jgi:hypothetical protein
MSARHLTPAERQRLVALLGMLGSDHAGERDNAAKLAEKFRRQYGLTWADLLNLQAAPAPEPPKPPPPRPEPQPDPFPQAVQRFHAAGRAAYPDWQKHNGTVSCLGKIRRLVGRPHGAVKTPTGATRAAILRPQNRLALWRVAVRYRAHHARRDVRPQYQSGDV